MRPGMTLAFQKRFMTWRQERRRVLTLPLRAKMRWGLRLVAYSGLVQLTARERAREGGEGGEGGWVVVVVVVVVVSRWKLMSKEWKSPIMGRAHVMAAGESRDP